MARRSTLRYDRGTLTLHPPPRGKAWVDYVAWDDRIEKFRLPALRYAEFVQDMRQHHIDIDDQAKAYSTLELSSASQLSPYQHQREALERWQRFGRRGVVVLPTGAGKTFVAQLAMEATPRSTLIVVPTLDLMHQWFANLEAAFPQASIGLLGGGSKDEAPILIATYDSAAIYCEKLGNLFGLIVFDECHHLPSEFLKSIAEYSIAPYRLGLTATPERSDGKDIELEQLIGPIVYRKTPEELMGSSLADYEIKQIKVKLSDTERKTYDDHLATRNAFLTQQKISLGSLPGWHRFVQASARTKQGRAAMLAHRAAREIAFGTEGKLRILAELLEKHHPERTLIFTDDNATVYRISKQFLIPAITHQTKVKERHSILQHFRDGSFPTLVASRVLNEGVDVPEASIGIVLSGTGSSREHIQRLGRILRKREQKRAILYEVVAENTSEEAVSKRRRERPKVRSSPAITTTRLADDEALGFDDL